MTMDDVRGSVAAVARNVLAWGQDRLGHLGIDVDAWRREIVASWIAQRSSIAASAARVGDAVGGASSALEDDSVEGAVDVLVALAWCACVALCFLRLPRRHFVAAAAFFLSGGPGLVAAAEALCVAAARCVERPQFLLAALVVVRVLGDGASLRAAPPPPPPPPTPPPPSAPVDPPRETAALDERLAKLERKIELLLHASAASSPAVLHGRGRGPRSPSTPAPPPPPPPATPSPSSLLRSDSSPRAGLRAAAAKVSVLAGALSSPRTPAKKSPSSRSPR